MREPGARHEPDVKDDAKNLTTVVGAGLVGVLLTAGLLFANASSDPVERVRVEVRTAPAAPVAPTPPTAPVAPAAPVSGSTRLYGTVTTRDGYAHRGYIRWDRNEGSWSDLLDATKLHRTRSATQTGIRFGHVQRIDVAGGGGATFTLKSGQQVEMGPGSTDLGSGLRALQVVDPQRGSTEFGWGDLESVAFEPAPDESPAAESRLYGTLTTRSGLQSVQVP